MADTDERLIERIAARDHAAFDTFYRRHIDRVVAYATRRCRDPHEVAELCAAVFLSVWDGAPTYLATRGTAAQWLAGISSRRFVDLRRTDRRQRTLRERIDARRVLHDDDIERIAQRIDAVRAADALADAVRSLPDSQRVVVLVMLDGLTAAEAAQVIGTSPTAIRMRLARSRRTLAGKLGDVGIAASTGDESSEVTP